jgi:hypothetical protein
MSEISISSILSGVFWLLFVLYMTKIVPNPSKKIMAIFRSPIVQFLIMLIVTYKECSNFAISVLISFAVLLIIRTIPTDNK